MNVHLLKMEKLKTSPLPSTPRCVPGGAVCKLWCWGGQRHTSSRGASCVPPPQCHPPRLLPGEHWGPRLWGAGWSPRPEGEGATSQPGRRLSITVAFRMEENRGVEKPGMGGDAQQHRPCTGTAFLPFSRLGTSRGSLPPWGTNHRWPDRAMGSDMAH